MKNAATTKTRSIRLLQLATILVGSVLHASAQPGSVGAWNSTTTFPYWIETPAALAFEGRIYVLGGYASGSGISDFLDSSVHVAAINGNGTLGSWTATTPFVNGRWLHAAALDSGNRTIYVIGGGDAGSFTRFADVQYARIQGNGSLGAWTATTSLPNGLSGHKAFCHNGYLYVFRGNDQFVGLAQGYYYAPIRPDGSLGNWTLGTFSFAVRRYFGAFAYNDHFYVLGGDNGGGTLFNQVKVSRVPQRSSLPYLQLNEAEFWNNGASFSVARTLHGTAADNGFLYVVGGIASSFSSVPDRSDVQFARVLSDGSLDSWQTTTALPTTGIPAARAQHACVAAGGYIYVIGGDYPQGGGYHATDSVLYAPILSAYDTTQPKTQISPAAGQQPSSPLSVTLTATDVGGSGVVSIRRTTDGSDPRYSGSAIVVNASSATFSLAIPATLKFSATDAAGNVELPQTVNYSVGSSTGYTPPQPTIDPFDASPNYFSANRGIGQIDTLVIHTTERGHQAGDGRDSDGYDPTKTFAENQLLAYTDAISWFRQSVSQVSAHYVVGPNGQIHQMVQDKDIAWHATYYNSRAIGIECAGFAGRTQTWNSPQLLDSLAKLVAWLCAKYQISVVHPSGDAIVGPLQAYSGYTGLGYKPGGLVAHTQIQPPCNAQSQCMTIKFQGNSLLVKTDPGIYFPWSTFVNTVLAKLNPPTTLAALQQISSGLSDSANTTPAVSAGGTLVGFKNSPTFHMVDATTGSLQAENSDGDGTLGNGELFSPVFSADFTVKAFASDNANLVTNDSNGVADVFVWTQTDGATERVSVSSAGDQANGRSYDVGISADGRFVAFTSVATNLVANDTNRVTDIFVRDRMTNQTFLVSVDTNGTQGNAPSYSPSISADGRFVAFISESTNLVGGDTNGFADVFVRDTQSNTTALVSRAWNGALANGACRQPSISGDGRYIAYESDASNLVPSDSNGYSDIFLYDSAAGTVQKLSTGPSGEQANGGSHNPRISSYGLRIAFTSDASNLSLNDTNGMPDVFVASFTAPPILNVSLAGNNVVLSWPTNDALFNLESTTNLNPSAVWSSVSPPPTAIGDQNFVTNSASGSAKFYRLKK